MLSPVSLARLHRTTVYTIYAKGARKTKSAVNASEGTVRVVIIPCSFPAMVCILQYYILTTYHLPTYWVIFNTGTVLVADVNPVIVNAKSSQVTGYIFLDPSSVDESCDLRPLRVLHQ